MPAAINQVIATGRMTMVMIVELAPKTGAVIETTPAALASIAQRKSHRGTQVLLPAYASVNQPSRRCMRAFSLWSRLPHLQRVAERALR